MKDKFNYPFIKDWRNKYGVTGKISFIDSGDFGSVYNFGRRYAIKKISKDNNTMEFKAVKDIITLNKKYKFIVKYYETHETNNFYYILMEKLDCSNNDYEIEFHNILDKIDDSIWELCHNHNYTPDLFELTPKNINPIFNEFIQLCKDLNLTSKDYGIDSNGDNYGFDRSGNIKLIDMFV